MNNLLVNPADDFTTKTGRIREELRREGVSAMLIGDNACLFWLTGRVFCGYAYVPAEGPEIFFVKRPVTLTGDGVVAIRKPEEIAISLSLDVPESLALELDVTPWSAVERLKGVFPMARIVNASPMLRRLRSVKTPHDLQLMKISGERQERIYRRIPHLYRAGMTDLELQVEIERESRLEGCLGLFRISGNSMELFMGNVISGDNADSPTPYDFAMGGAGLGPSLPVGADGSVIRPGAAVMVDVNGNYTGYMTDMTRTFAVTTLSDEAMKAHRLSIDICKAVAAAAKPGAEARDLYTLAESMAREAGLGRYFMGHAQKAGFVGHGVGIEVNEMPVLAPRSRDILRENNTIAVEPKFVIPGVGAVGIENTYHITASGAQCMTNAPEQIITLQ